LRPAFDAGRCDRLLLVAAAWLARFSGLLRTYADPDLRVYLAWRADREIDPLTAEPAADRAVGLADAGGAPVEAHDGGLADAGLGRGSTAPA
jgi:hypothetical protein